MSNRLGANAAALDRLRNRIVTGVVTDALTRLGLDGWMEDILPMRRDTVVIGPAYTVRCAPRRGADGLGKNLYQIIRECERDDVLVIEALGTNTSVFGGNIANCGSGMRFRRWRIYMLRNRLLSISALAVTFVYAANGQTITAPNVPANLRVPSGHTAFLKGTAVGTQNYICLPSGSALAWKFLAPQATVFLTFRWFGGDASQQILTHFLSPNPQEAGTPARATWQSSVDTSAVWGRRSRNRAIRPTLRRKPFRGFCFRR